MYFCKILVKLLLVLVNLALAFLLRYILTVGTRSHSTGYILVLDETFLDWVNQLMCGNPVLTSCFNFEVFGIYSHAVSQEFWSAYSKLSFFKYRYTVAADLYWMLFLFFLFYSCVQKNIFSHFCNISKRQQIKKDCFSCPASV